MSDPSEIPTCPACGWVDWWRDGLVIQRTSDEAIEVRAYPPIGEPNPALWNCMHCGFEVGADTLREKALNELAAT